MTSKKSWPREMPQTDFDVVIIGGGMVGASMAIALAHLPIQIAIIEAYPLRADSQPSFDARSIALAYGSKIIFNSIGIWNDIEKDACPIKKIHVSSQGEFGITHLNAADEGLDALGYVIENRLLGNALLKKIESFPNIQLICPAELADLTDTADNVHVKIKANSSTMSLNAKLVIGADGANSKVRELLNITSYTKEYNQTAIISNVMPGKPHQHIAYERFTKDGPIAVLPMTNNRYSLVFTVDSKEADDILKLNDEKFLQLLESRFGFRTGGFIQTSKRIAYPLSLMQIKTHCKSRVVIIGNAAHTLHPIAGQGFNLGIRDVSCLAEIITNAISEKHDIGALAVLQNYEHIRKKDQNSVASITDGLAQVFSNQLFPLTQLRSIGLLTSDLIPAAKHAMAKRAMGLTGTLPKLSRGVPL